MLGVSMNMSEITRDIMNDEGKKYRGIHIYEKKKKDENMEMKLGIYHIEITKIIRDEHEEKSIEAS